MSLHKNKKAYYDYEVLKEYTAGIELTGGEVRSCRNQNVNFKGSYISIKGNKVILKGSTIGKFSFDQVKGYEPKRERILFLREKEIIKIQNELNNQGLTLIPLELFTKGRLIKIKIGLARGKKKYDKREAIKKRDIARRKIV